MFLLFAVALATPATSQQVNLLHQVEPRFPREARLKRVHHAECEVVVRITAEGVPDDVHALDCDPLFVDTTVAAVRRWRFEAIPAQPTVFRVVVTYDYPRKPGEHVALVPAGSDTKSAPVATEHPPAAGVDPAATEPVASEPIPAEPVASDPEVSGPEVSDPGVTPPDPVVEPVVEPTDPPSEDPPSEEDEPRPEPGKYE